MRWTGAPRGSAWRGGIARQLLPAEPAVQHRRGRLHLLELAVRSLQLQLQKRFAQGLSFGVNYTLAKSTDDVSNDTRGAGTELVVPSDPKQLDLDKGRSDFDVRHVFRGTSSGICRSDEDRSISAARPGW